MLVTRYSDVYAYRAGSTIRYNLNILKCKTFKVFIASEWVISPQRCVQRLSHQSSAYPRLFTPVSLLDWASGRSGLGTGEVGSWTALGSNSPAFYLEETDSVRMGLPPSPIQYLLLTQAWPELPIKTPVATASDKIIYPTRPIKPARVTNEGVLSRLWGW